MAVPHRLIGKKALVNGASRGIGRAAAPPLRRRGRERGDQPLPRQSDGRCNAHRPREGHADARHCAFDADIGSGEEIAAMFEVLPASCDDSRYVTGQMIFACGGITLYGEFKVDWAS